MPTSASRPTLEATQAVGAILLHQFARERFLNAGIDESLICEAEDREQLNALANTLLREEGDLTNDTSCHTQNEPHNLSGQSSCNGTTCQADEQTTREMSSHLIDGLSHNNSHTTNNDTNNSTSFQTSANNTTLRSEGDGQQADRPSELFHSINETGSVNGTPQRSDRTIYHSMNASSPNAAGSPFERLQTAPCLASYGRELRRIADEFEKTRLREIVKERAGEVNLLDITREKFVQLLEELFEGKITRAKVVILFFFCTDVALRAALSAQELVVKLLGWSFSYIVNTVCSFVYKLGGWDKVLYYNFFFHLLPSLMVTCTAFMAIVWLGVSIRRILRS